MAGRERSWGTSLVGAMIVMVRGRKDGNADEICAGKRSAEKRWEIRMVRDTKMTIEKGEVNAASGGDEMVRVTGTSLVGE